MSIKLYKEAMVFSPKSLESFSLYLRKLGILDLSRFGPVAV
jgi:hypothetical protein